MEKEQPSIQIKEHDEMFCTSCGKLIKKETFVCPHCGVRNKKTSESNKNKTVAALLALFLGGLGVHKLYLERRESGILRLAICLIGVVLIVLAFIFNASLPDYVWENNISPMGILFGALAILLLQIIAIIEGIILLCMNKDKFDERYNN